MLGSHLCEACSFLKEKGGGVDLEELGSWGRDQKEWKGQKTEVKMQCMREEN